MQSKVQRWGNSLGLRIPKSFASELGVEAGSEVDVTVEDGQLIIRPSRRRHDLWALLKEITSDNIHRPVDEGEPVGAEW